MSSTNNANSSIAEQRADDVAAGRQQIDARRATIERYRANELAEAEALALARIKADTERALAHQAQVLRDAERAAELKAIERRSADLEATKEAQRRQTLDEEAAMAAAARSDADRLAAQTAHEKTVALAAAHEARQSRLNAEREALAARRDSRTARMAQAWIAVRSASAIAVGLVALLLGIVAGGLHAEWRDYSPAVPVEITTLKLDRELAKPPVRR